VVLVVLVAAEKVKAKTPVMQHLELLTQVVAEVVHLKREENLAALELC
jgi:hypothetical protein